MTDTSTPAAGNDDRPPFATWALVELLGHRRMVAYVTEVTIAGKGFLRLDEPAVGDIPARSQLVNPDSIYALHPMTQDAAMVYAERMRTQLPLNAWDLPHDVQAAMRVIEAQRHQPDEPGDEHQGHPTLYDQL